MYNLIPSCNKEAVKFEQENLVCIYLFCFLVSSYIVVQYFIMDGFQTGLVKVKLMFGSKLSVLVYDAIYTYYN